MDSQLIFKEHRIEIHSHLTGTYREDIIRDALAGLTAPQKHIPSKYFYDGRGSELFEQICRLPEYYPTRTEMSILENAAPAIMESFECGDLVELGSGANRKIRTLLDAADENTVPHLRYVPVDVSRTAMVSSAEELLLLYPSLEVTGIVADFMVHLERVPSGRPRLLLFLGSTIGNLDGASRNRFLRKVSDQMNPRDRFLVGFDMIKPKKDLEAAYNDSLGVTSEFNKNILHVLNRELHAGFNPSLFHHVAFFNEQQERVEMHLRANQGMKVPVDDLGLTCEMDRDETIHTEICTKFSRSCVHQMADEAGLRITRWFCDSREWFSLVEFAVSDE